MSPIPRIYLDHHATTPVDPRVLEAMLPWFTEHFGNPASRNHGHGWIADKAVADAREILAGAIGARSREIVFTSGATESNNLALKGLADLFRTRPRHIVSVRTEHKSVLDPLKRLQKDGVEVTLLAVDPEGRLDLEALAAALTPATILISVMAANNEVGTLQPVEAIGRLAKERGILFHCDATQAMGRIPVDVTGWNVDLMSFSAHKLYGPKGVGALYVRSHAPRVRLMPLQDGGGHERGLRSGTLNVPGIVGFARALALGEEVREEESARLFGLRERLHRGLADRIPGLRLNGHPTQRLPGTLNVSFPGVDGEALMMGLPEIAISSGSACTSATLEPSYVLRAMGLSDDLAQASLRFGLGRFNTADEIDVTIEKVQQTVERLRALSPRWRTIDEAPTARGSWASSQP